MKPPITVPLLCQEARSFAEQESTHDECTLFGVTDGKAVGTYFEHKFRAYLLERYEFESGSSAKGIDFPALEVDMKVTSARQPQSSCPYESADQKVFGLGYSILVFVYENSDDPSTRTGRLTIAHTIFVQKHRTADFQTSSGIQKILENHGNADDLEAFIMDRHLPVDEVGAAQLAERILKEPPETGYLTISNALQWRLQYKRIIEKAGAVDGVERLL